MRNELKEIKALYSELTVKDWLEGLAFFISLGAMLIGLVCWTV